MYRILREAAPVEGGGADTPPPEAKAEPTPAPAAPKVVSVPEDQYASIWSELTSLRKFQADAEAARQQAVEAERQKYLAELGETKGAKAALEEAKRLADEALSASRKETADLRATWVGEKKQNFLLSGLSSYSGEFVSDDAREQCLALLDSEFSASDEGGKVTFRDRQNRFADPDGIKALLESSRYSHFFKAGNRGGAGAKGGSQPAGGGVEKSPLEQLAASMEANRDKGVLHPGFLRRVGN